MQNLASGSAYSFVIFLIVETSILVTSAAYSFVSVEARVRYRLSLASCQPTDLTRLSPLVRFLSSSLVQSGF